MSRYAYSLKPFGSSQKDFYGKAIVIVIVTRDKYESTERLISYETQVTCHDYNSGSTIGTLVRPTYHQVPYRLT